MNTYTIETRYGAKETPYSLSVRLDSVGQRKLREVYQQRTGKNSTAEAIILDALDDNDTLVDVISCGLKHRYNKNPHLNPIDVVDGMDFTEGIITRCQIVVGIAVCSGLLSPVFADALIAAAHRQEQQKAEMTNSI